MPASTAAMSRRPSASTVQYDGRWTAKITSPSRVKVSAPATVPTKLPCPPNRLVPPMTTAATDGRIRPSPEVGSPEAVSIA